MRDFFSGYKMYPYFLQLDITVLFMHRFLFVSLFSHVFRVQNVRFNFFCFDTEPLLVKKRNKKRQAGKPQKSTDSCFFNIL